MLEDARTSWRWGRSRSATRLSPSSPANSMSSAAADGSPAITSADAGGARGGAEPRLRRAPARDQDAPAAACSTGRSSGHGQIVTIVGEPGHRQVRLLSEFRQCHRGADAPSCSKADAHPTASTCHTCPALEVVQAVCGIQEVGLAGDRRTPKCWPRCDRSGRPGAWRRRPICRTCSSPRKGGGERLRAKLSRRGVIKARTFAAMQPDRRRPAGTRHARARRPRTSSGSTRRPRSSWPSSLADVRGQRACCW